jgi:hypothetical protein
MRTGTRHISALGPQCRKFVTDAATGLEREPGFMNLGQDVLHRVADVVGGLVERFPCAVGSILEVAFEVVGGTFGDLFKVVERFLGLAA